MTVIISNIVNDERTVVAIIYDGEIHADEHTEDIITEKLSIGDPTPLIEEQEIVGRISSQSYNATQTTSSIEEIQQTEELHDSLEKILK